MVKVFKVLGLFFLAAVFVMGAVNDADAKKKKKKKIPAKPSYVGSVKCNGSCHDPYYQAWLNTPHGKSFESLKSGVKGDAKKKAGLDPEKDYTGDPLCLRCHTTGYAQTGGFKAAGSKSKKGKDTASKIDPEEPNKEQVGCEMCHSAAGGAQFRIVMKNTKGDFKKEDIEKYGLRWDYSNVCTRCHNHSKNPFTAKVDKKYEFDYEAKKGLVHQIDEYWNEDNEDQKPEKVKDRAEEKSKSEVTPLVIENFSVKNGKLKFKKGTKPYSSKKNEFYYQK